MLQNAIRVHLVALYLGHWENWPLGSYVTNKVTPKVTTCSFVSVNTRSPWKETSCEQSLGKSEQIKEERSSWATDSSREPWQRQTGTIGCSVIEGGEEGRDEQHEKAKPKGREVGMKIQAEGVGMKGGTAVLVARPVTSLLVLFSPPLLFKGTLTQLASIWHENTSVTKQRWSQTVSSPPLPSHRAESHNLSRE